MITKIALPLRAPFDHCQVEVNELNNVCFLFGPNGSGKTTISQLIADEACDVDSDVLSWDGAGPIATYVYNRTFVNKNFASDSAVPGVFTIGEESVNAKRRSKEISRDIDARRLRRKRDLENLNEVRKELEKVTDQIREICWSVRSELPDSVKSRWNGTGRKEPFRNTLLLRIDRLNENEPIPDISEIERRIGIVFDESVAAVAPLPAIDFEQILAAEKEPVLAKIIVGKRDLPISELINRLGNSDWIARGRVYIGKDDVCPFCQSHTITDKLRSEMEQFFDEGYEENVSELKQVYEVYASAGKAAVKSIERIINDYRNFVDAESLGARAAELTGALQSNMARIEKKIGEPSIPIVLSSTEATCGAIFSLLREGTDNVIKHNEMVAHRTEEKTRIIEELWQYAAMIAKPRVGELRSIEARFENKVNGLQRSISQHDKAIREMEGELNRLERSFTNVHETADAINRLLLQFGFSNFHLVVTGDDCYQIERMDGTPARETLSEGEYSFLTFLYFYHLMSGSQGTSGVNDKRVVVIDDPVSSMDAEVLFVVSSMVRRLAREARSEEGTTSQLIVLTHNITFYREVTFVRSGEGDAKTSYYFIRKHEGYSTIEKCVSNPVSSTYELLWQDLCRDDCSPLTAQNVARRITETFFKLIGGTDLDGAIAEMQSPDREIAQSYAAWANAGSHSPFDDETYFNTTENVEVYRRVLRMLFEAAGYVSHYDEMAEKYSHHTN